VYPYVDGVFLKDIETGKAIKVINPSKEKYTFENPSFDRWSFSHDDIDDYSVSYNEAYALSHKGNYIDRYITCKFIENNANGTLSWVGSCVGFAVTTALCHHRYLYTQGKNLWDFELNENNKSIINYFYQTCNMFDCRLAITSFMKKSDAKKIDFIDSLAQNASTKPFVIAFNGNGVGHWLVGYKLERGSFTYNGTTYNSRVLLYDCNDIAMIDDVCFYYNQNTDEWEISNYNYPNIELATVKKSVLDPHNYVADAVLQEEADGNTNNTRFLTLSGTDYNFTLKIDTTTYKISSETKDFNNGIVSFFDVYRTENNANEMYVTLPDEFETITIIPGDNTSEFIYNSADFMISMDFESVDSLTFTYDGKLVAEKIIGEYQCTMVYNETNESLPWYYTQISGNDSENLSVEKTEEGISFSDNDLGDITVTVADDNSVKSKSTSGQSGSALLTKATIEGKDEPVLLFDDGDSEMLEAINSENSEYPGWKKVDDYYKDGELMGDVNIDGDVTFTDFTRLAQYISGNKNYSVNLANSDFDSDNKLTTNDLRLLLPYIFVE